MPLQVRPERGQAMIEMAITLLIFLMVTAGLIDVGRSIASYNELSAIARYGARWGSVVGGTCQGFSKLGNSSNDWCNLLATGVPGGFWTQLGNKPLQGAGVACPTYSTTPADWYTVNTYVTAKDTTVLGALAQHFDTSSQTPNTVVGAFAPGLDYSKLRVCVALSRGSPPEPGDTVTVDVDYSFAPAGKLLSSGTVDLTAEAHWQVEG